MFGKTRKKIIALVMAAMVVVLTVTLIVVYGTSSYELKKENTEKLDRYAAFYSLEAQPGSEAAEYWEAALPDLPIGVPPDVQDQDLRLLTFYSAAVNDDGKILAVDAGRTGIYSEEAIGELAKEVMALGRESGRHENLDYMTADKDGYTLVAFMDNTLERSTLNTLLRQMLITGVISLAAVFVISVILSGRILRPLEENDKRQRQFVSDAGHELKTPVSVIGTNVELLERQGVKNEWIDNIRYENERMGELVTSMLQLSRAENIQTVSGSIDLEQLVMGELLPFESVAYEKGLSIQSDIDSGIFVTGDAQGLRRMVSVLLDNAVNYSEGGEIKVSLKKDRKSAVLSVANKGKAISPDKMEHLFERFFRGDDARTAEGGNYGLGLAIAKAVAEKHNGTIKASCENQEIIFTVTLPLEK